MTDYEIQEFLKCKEDLYYFIDNYVKIQHPLKGIINFKLYNYQKKLLKQFEDKNFNIIFKDRQKGISTLLLVYCIWKCLFYEKENILYVTPYNCTFLINKIKTIISFLQNYMKQKVIFNQNDIKFENGSNISNIHSKHEHIKFLHRHYSLCIFDESYINIDSKRWKELIPFLANGGQCIMTFTYKYLSSFEWMRIMQIMAKYDVSFFSEIGDLK